MRLSHMLAMAVVLGLVAAMFAAFPLSRAAVGDSVGDVSANSGFCVEGAGDDGDIAEKDDNTYMVNAALDGSGDAVNVYHPDNTVDTVTDVDGDATTQGIQGDADSKPDAMVLTCAASQAGQPIKITPNGTVTPIIEALSPSVSISFGDSDAMVKADSELTVDVKLANFESASISGTAPQVDWVRVSGVLDGTEDNSEDIELTGGRGTADFDADATGQQGFKIIIPDGTPAGEYTVSALVIFDLTAAGGEADADEGTPPIGRELSI